MCHIEKKVGNRKNALIGFIYISFETAVIIIKVDSVIPQNFPRLLDPASWCAQISANQEQ
jgi:hypothetical protein